MVFITLFIVTHFRRACLKNSFKQRCIIFISCRLPQLESRNRIMDLILNYTKSLQCCKQITDFCKKCKRDKENIWIKKWREVVLMWIGLCSLFLRVYCLLSLKWDPPFKNIINIKYLNMIQFLNEKKKKKIQFNLTC
jgi:hypothetical protein